MADGGARRVERAEVVDLHEVPHRRGIGLVETAVVSQAGVAHHHVEAPGDGHGCRHDRVDLRRVCHVAGDGRGAAARRGDGRCHAVQLIGTSRREHDVQSLAGEGERTGLADARRGTRDHGGQAVAHPGDRSSLRVLSSAV